MTLATRIETIITDTLIKENTCPTLQSIADEIGFSERTLRRRLCKEGVTIRSLIERARLNIVRQSSDCSLEELAESLGYAEARSVSRLIRKFSVSADIKGKMIDCVDAARR